MAQNNSGNFQASGNIAASGLTANRNSIKRTPSNESSFVNKNLGMQATGAGGGGHGSLIMSGGMHGGSHPH